MAPVPLQLRKGRREESRGGNSRKGHRGVEDRDGRRGRIGNQEEMGQRRRGVEDRDGRRGRIGNQEGMGQKTGRWKERYVTFYFLFKFVIFFLQYCNFIREKRRNRGEREQCHGREIIVM